MENVTPQDFKDLFVYDFPYLPIWDETKTYKIDAEVYLSSNDTFYKSLQADNTNHSPDEASSLWWVAIDESAENYISDADITRAMLEADLTFNPGLFEDEDQAKMPYLYLTAHYLVGDVKARLQGVESQGAKTVASKSVGSVSESYNIPEYYNNPAMSFFTTTAYGLKYLNLVYPRLIGNVAVVKGATTLG